MQIFLWPPWEGGPKIHMVDYVTSIYIIRHVNFFALLPQGGHKKIGIKCAFLLE